MNNEELLEKAKNCYSNNSDFVPVFNKLLSACGEEPLKPSFSAQMNIAAITIICIEEDEVLVTLLEIAVAICEGGSLGESLDELMSKIDKTCVYELGKTLLYDFGIGNSYVNEYPYIVNLTISNAHSEAGNLHIDFCEGVNRVNCGKYRGEYSASEIASAIMWCLRGVPAEVIDEVSPDYFLTESAKRRLLNGESKSETVLSQLQVEARGGCFCGCGGKAVFSLKGGKIVSDFCTEPRKICEADDFFEGLWNNALIKKFGVFHGCFADVLALAQENRNPVLIDMSEIGYDENVLNKLLSLKNQIIILE